MKQLQILKDLISVNSENPCPCEKKVARHISRLLQQHGIPSILVETSKDRFNLVGKLEGNKPQTLLFNGHMDTKSAGSSWTTDPFEPTLSGGRMYGLGACDMKGGIAAILAALLVRSKESRRDGTVAFHFVADEEMNSRYGTRYLIDHGYLDGVALAIVAEPSSMNLVTRSVGNAWLKLSLTGRASHAGRYWDGTNAIDRMHEWLSLIERRIFVMREKTNKFPEKSFPNVNVGYIRGGSHPGTVPSHCETLIDIRFFDETMREVYLRVVSDSAAEISRRRKCAVDIELFGGGGMPAWDITTHPGSKDAIKLLGEAYESVIKRNPKRAAFLGGSDAGLISHNAGIPALILGPGNLEQAHMPNEWVDVREVSEASLVYLEIMRRW